MSLSFSERAELAARGYTEKDIQAINSRLGSTRYRVDSGRGVSQVAASIAAGIIGRAAVVKNAIAGKKPATIYI